MVQLVEFLCILDVGAEIELLSYLLRDRELIARQHLDIDAHVPGCVDGLSRIISRRVEQRKDAEHVPGTIPTRRCNAERAESPSGKCVYRLLHLRVNVLTGPAAELAGALVLLLPLEHAAASTAIPTAPPTPAASLAGAGIRFTMENRISLVSRLARAGRAGPLRNHCRF